MADNRPPVLPTAPKSLLFDDSMTHLFDGLNKNSNAAIAAAIAANRPFPTHDAVEQAVTSSAVSWAAIFAGAIAAAALSLILLILGTGLGLSAVSPWAPNGISAGSFGVSAIVWITLTQLLASGMGGYLAGRLRSRWVSVHTDEVYFRDTVHGFLAWGVASLVTAAVLASATGAIVSGGVQAGAGGAALTAAGAKKGGVSAGDAADYFIDSLFRKDPATAPAGTAVPHNTTDASPATSAAEVGRIFLNSIRSGALPPDDIRYVGQLVAQRSGLSQADAEKRVSETFTRLQTKLREAETAVRDAADKARKASAYAALWIFISLLIGAFVASLMATVGGRQRDAQMHYSHNL